MTAAASPPGGGQPRRPGAVSSRRPADFHLVESATGWTLHVTPRPDLLRALTSSAAPIAVTVHIEPNLVPGGPFPATVVTHSGGPEPRPS